MGLTTITPSDAIRLPWQIARYRIDVWPIGAFAVVLATTVLIVSLLAAVVWLSLLKGHPGAPDLSYTVDNYATFADPFTHRVLLNTLGFACVTTIIALLFGLPAAWLCERTDLGGKTIVFTLMAVSLLMPGFAAAMGFQFLLHPRIGLVNVLLRDIFDLADGPFNVGTIVGMGFVQGLGLAPVAFIMTAAVFRAMDPSLEEAAQIAGARPTKVLWKVTLPLAWPGILAAAIYVFTIGFAAFDVPAIIGWSNRIFTFSTYMLLLLAPDDALPRYGPAAALGTFVILLGGAMTWWYTLLHRHAHRYQVISGKAYRPNIIQLKRTAVLAWAYLAFYFLISKLVPILVIVWVSIIPYFQLPSAAALEQVSLARYIDQPWDLVMTGLRNTGLLMVLTPTITLIMSLMFSWVVIRSKLPGRAAFDLVAFLPHAVPSIIFSVGALLLVLYLVDRVLPIYGTVWVLLIVFIVARLSYGTRMTNGGLIQIHRELEESARITGATTAKVMRRIVCPLLAPTLLYAWLWIALLTFRELTLAVVLTTRDNMTLPILIWATWVGGQLADASAIAVIMLLCMTPLIAVYWLVARRRTGTAPT